MAKTIRITCNFTERGNGSSSAIGHDMISATDSRLPVIYSFRIFAIEGGLISIAADYGGLFRRAAGYVDKIRKGSHPADLPVEPPRKFALIINLNTARSLDLIIPPAILARADEVIDQRLKVIRV
jgi:putative ABC transport system substrate-binding protein